MRRTGAVRAILVYVQRLRDWAGSLAAAPPGWKFHAVLVLPALALLYAYSFPGMAFFVWILAAWVLLGASVVWAVRLLGFFVWRRRRGPTVATGRARWFAIAPLGAVVVGLLLWVDAPLRARWQISRGAFDRAARQVQAGELSGATYDSRRLGLYTVTNVEQVKRGILFYEETGSFLDDAGFAYLPGGPSPELENGGFENPQFVALGNGWYAWTASW